MPVLLALGWDTNVSRPSLFLGYRCVRLRAPVCFPISHRKPVLGKREPGGQAVGVLEGFALLYCKEEVTLLHAKE